MGFSLSLCPLAGVTDQAFRLICQEMGADKCYTEMISAKGLYYRDKKTNSLMEINPKENNTAIQIFGSDPKIMAEVVKKYINPREDIDSVDINMGCPAPKIIKNGEGSALMKDPILVGKIVGEITKVSTKKVSVKFRSGFTNDSLNYLEIGKICQEMGASHVTLHARTCEQMYSGKANWDHIASLKEALDIEVIGNGDIFSPEDAKKMLTYTKVDGLAIARGAMGNPFIFSMVKDFISKGNYSEPNLKQIIDTIKLQYDLSEKFKGKERAVIEMRKNIGWYLKSFKSSKKVKDLINRTEEKKEVFKILDEYFLQNS